MIKQEDVNHLLSAAHQNLLSALTSRLGQLDLVASSPAGQTDKAFIARQCELLRFYVELPF
jgi:hypothetical protein